MKLSALRCLALAGVIGAAAACGKKGPPLPPLRPVPVAVSGFTAERVGLAVTLRFMVPGGNLDGSTPPAVERVEIYALTLPAGAPAPRAIQLLVPGNLAATVGVRAAAEAPAGAPPDPRPAAGQLASHVDAALRDGANAEGPLVRYYAAAGLAGRRRGPLSSILAVPLSLAPAAPAGLKADYTERTLTISWQPAAAGQRFLVEETDAGGARAARVTPGPLTAVDFATPFEFGRERCFAVRAVEGTGAVTTVGAPTTPVCVTPTDRFAPPTPSGLLAVASEGGVELLWTASPAADLAGYVVLRGEGANGTLQRLTPAPIAATQYRDQDARAGVTYVYAIIAVDSAAPPNASEPSNRQVVTARQP